MTVLRRISMILSLLAGLFAGYVVYNQFDIGNFPETITAEDLPTAPFDTGNGYYRLITLTEPPGADIMSEPVVMKYRRLFDPKYDDEKYLKERDRKAYKNMFAEELKFIRAQLKPVAGGPSNWIDGYVDLENDWCEAVLTGKADIRAIETRWQVYLDRYRELIACDDFEDFSPPHPGAQWPDLLGWLQIGRLYIVSNMLDALEGNWEKGVRALLAHTAFSKRANKGTHMPVSHLISKAMARNTLNALVNLMNREECPKEIFKIILDGLPPIHYDEYGARKGYLYEYLSAKPFKEWEISGWEDSTIFTLPAVRFLLHENRTRKYFHDYFADVIRDEQTPPYLWDFDLEKRLHGELLDTGPLWWLQNPGGKILINGAFSKNRFRGLLGFMMKSFQLKALYDLTRISAELHLKYDPHKPVMETLQNLESYKTIDPCSGKPYVWNDQKQRLYGLGTDKDDDNGKMDYRNPLDSDFAIPVILFINEPL
ncbi:MAG: hypothetical protein GY950_06965 [bacterium]|nr:hypothetical protein [bacterium]